MDKHISLLDKGCERLGFKLTEDQLEQFNSYIQLLLSWNKKFNLTAIVEAEEIVIRHFLDSLTVLEPGLIRPDSSLIDIGAGAGFPSVPLKILLPDLKVVQIDSVNKKVSFLNELINKLAFKETQALHARAEDLAKEADMRETFDFAVSRAVADLRVLFEYSLPFVRLGGYCIFNKGPTVESELKAAQRAASILGSDRPVARQVLVPFSDRSHWLVTAKKIKNTANKYPRRAGIPKKDPL